MSKLNLDDPEGVLKMTKKGKSLMMFATVVGLSFFYISRYKQDSTYHGLCQCRLGFKKGKIIDDVCKSCRFVVFLHFKI